MKRFFYSHPRLLLTALASLILLPAAVGLLVPLFLEIAGIALDNWTLLALMVGGPLLSLLFALPFACVPSLKKLDETLEALSRLKCARKVFHAPTADASISDAKSRIARNLEKRGLTGTDAVSFPTSAVACEGIWTKDIILRPKYGTNTHAVFYLLYTVDHLDVSAWELLQEILDRQLLALEGASLRRGSKKPAYAVCVLCKDADASIPDKVQSIRSYKITDAHVCVGIIPSNDWFLPAYRVAGHDPTELARRLLGKGTFGLRCSTFPYKGNRAYTDEFSERVELLCASHSSNDPSDPSNI